MSDILIWINIGLGLLLFVLIGTSAWLKSRHLYRATVIALTAWFAALGLEVGVSNEIDTAILVPTFTSLLAVYLFMLYIFTYKFILREPFLQTVHPEKLKQTVLNKAHPTVFERTIIYAPWVLVGLLIVVVVTAYRAGY